MFQRELGQVFSCPTTLSFELGKGWDQARWRHATKRPSKCSCWQGLTVNRHITPPASFAKSSGPHMALSSMGTLSMSQGQPLPPQALLHQLMLSPPLYSSPRRNTSSTRHQRSFTRSWKRS